jgi:3-phosphoshikimate 1-carboxyvinyltransferase
MGLNPLRIRYIELLKNMGAQIVVDETGERLGEPIGSVRVESSQLKGCIIEASEGIIDEIPILAVAAAFAQGETEFRQVAELKVKESDRISTLTQELGRLGVEVESGEDLLIINGGQPQPGQVSSHGDHRLALSLAVAANALTGDTVIEGWSAADVSYPDFVVDLDRLTAGQ